MDWVIGIVMLILGFCLDRLWEWWKKKKAGLTGQAHSIIRQLGNAVQAYDGHYYLSKDPTQNYKIAKHVYEHCSGDVVATCFRENPAAYKDHDLARLLPKGVSFARLTNDKVFSVTDKEATEATLKELVSNSKVVIVPSSEYITSIDGIFCELPDETNIAFVTFPKMSDGSSNRGIIFYGHTARAFYEYFRDLRNTYSNEK